MYIIDYHVHSIFSSDSNSLIDDIIMNAISKNISEIAITDHFEPMIYDPNYLYYNGIMYQNIIEEVTEKYSNKIKILKGIELGQPHRFLESSYSVVADYPMDYVIASAHKGANDIDVSELRYTENNKQIRCRNYLAELIQISKLDVFDCIGHLDLINRYAIKQGVFIDLAEEYELLEVVFNNLIYNNKGIEINTSGLRNISRIMMPGYSIAKMYKELGGEIITIGSDAHDTRHVGTGIKEAIEMLNHAGFRYITTYENRNPKFISICNTPKYYSMAI